MGERNTNIGGTDWSSEFLLTPDLNDTFNALGAMARGSANAAYLNYTNSDINQGYLGADKFTDATGYNNTIDTTNTTCVWWEGGTAYTLPLSNSLVVGDTTNTTSTDGTWSDSANAFDGDDSTQASNIILNVSEDFSAYTRNGYLGKTFTSRLITYVRVKAQVQIAITGGLTTSNSSLVIQTYDGATWSDAVTLISTTGTNGGVQYDGLYYLNTTTQGVRLRLTSNTQNSSTGNPETTTVTARVWTLEYNVFETSGIIETDRIMYTRTNPKSICVVPLGTITSDHGVTISASGNGGSSFPVIGGTIDTPFNVTTIGGTQLALRMHLSTTNTATTPMIKGYGLVVIR